MNNVERVLNTKNVERTMCDRQVNTDDRTRRETGSCK